MYKWHENIDVITVLEAGSCFKVPDTAGHNKVMSYWSPEEITKYTKQQSPGVFSENKGNQLVFFWQVNPADSSDI